jgi:hypothetical protein
MMLSIDVETELEALDGERKPLLTLQESVPEQTAPSCLEFPGMSIVSQSHHRSWVGVGGERRVKMLVADVHVFRGGSAVDAGNEHGRETGCALLTLSGAASDDHETQFMYFSCLEASSSLRNYASIHNRNLSFNHPWPITSCRTLAVTSKAIRSASS